MNTYGLQSINTSTFNTAPHSNVWYPRNSRNVIVSALRVHNLTLNVLGYIPGVSVISGCVRIGTGLLFCAMALAVGDRKATQGVIIGRWYDEALLTGCTQIARGILEAFVPVGRTVNVCLDAVATIINFASADLYTVGCPDCRQGPPEGYNLESNKRWDYHMDKDYHGNSRHKEPEYPFPLTLLYLV